MEATNTRVSCMQLVTYLIRDGELHRAGCGSLLVESYLTPVGYVNAAPQAASSRPLPAEKDPFRHAILLTSGMTGQSTSTEQEDTLQCS